jgi:hypothetical protein
MLVVLGVLMLVLGIAVEERPAVAAPLVVLGPLIAMVGILFEGWSDSVAEMSLGQSGLTLKRQLPTSEDLTKAGVPPEAARELGEALNAFAEQLPAVIDARIREHEASRVYRSRALKAFMQQPQQREKDR